VHTPDRNSKKQGLPLPNPIELAKLAELSSTLFADAPPLPIKQKVTPRQLKRRLSPETRQALVVRYQAGESKEALRREFGLTATGLSDLLLAETAVYRQPPMAPGEIDLAVQLYETGLNVRQIVMRLGFPLGTIRRVLRERAVSMRRFGTRN
jgi:hypothetical protein